MSCFCCLIMIKNSYQLSKQKRKNVTIINCCTYMYPAKIFSKVVFPAPLVPIIAVSSPEQNFPLIDFRMPFLPVI